MRPLRLLGWAALVLALSGLAGWLLERDAGAARQSGLALPGFAARLDAIDRIEVIGAGDTRLVVLEKTDGQWRMPSRDGWPGNQREIGRALFRMGQARRVEAKTADPRRHSRLGVESVTAADAKGSVLRLGGGGETVDVLVGNNHPSLGGSYVRVGDDPQVWLLDEDLAPARRPADWLDRRLLDVAMARIDTVRVQPAKGRAFELSRVQDRFSVDGLPPTAMADPDLGNALAAFPDQLPLDDVARDSATAATQTVIFKGLDGLQVTVSAWSEGEETWARLAVELDPARAATWFAQAAATPAAAVAPGVTRAPDAGDQATGPDIALASAAATPAGRLLELTSKVEQMQARFAGRQFLLPPDQAEVMMRSRDDYLATRR